MKHLLSSTAFLVPKEEYFKEKGTLDNGWFFNSGANIEKDTTLTPYQQKKSIDKLKKLGIVETKLKGLPATLHFKLFENKLLSFLDTCIEVSLKVDAKELRSNKNNLIRITNKIIYNKDAFVLEVMSFDYDKNILEGFIDYWTEPNKSKTKMKFELQKTWSTNLRLKNWVKIQKKWDAPTKPNKNKLTKNIETMKNVLNKLNGYD
jgi:hypothetical protein